MLRLKVDPVHPDPDLVARAADVIRAGGLVAMPTDTLYGIAADPFNASAVRRVFAAKGRPTERALPLVAADLRQVEVQLGVLPPLGRTLADHFWPGPLTLLVAATNRLGADVTGGTGKVGVRVPRHAVPRELCRSTACVLTATSANVSGEPPSSRADDVMVVLGARIDVLLDAGSTVGGEPSTIVDVTAPEPRLVRAGAISWETIQACV